MVNGTQQLNMEEVPWVEVEDALPSVLLDVVRSYLPLDESRWTPLLERPPGTIYKPRWYRKNKTEFMLEWAYRMGYDMNAVRIIVQEPILSDKLQQAVREALAALSDVDG